jgi:enamine deaminase RidA (YjgF/YER057c/UK114 family)
VPPERPVFSSPDDLESPPGYSHVVSIPAGRLVWTAGQVGIDADGVAPESFEAQTRLAFENVGRALRAGGADWPDVVKLTIFAVDVSEVGVIRAARDEFVDSSRPPTSSLVQVAGLVRSDCLIEIEAVAWREEAPSA